MEVFYPKCVSHHCKNGYEKKIELHVRTYQGRIALLPGVRGHDDHRVLVPSYRSSMLISWRTLNRIHLGSQRATSLVRKAKDLSEISKMAQVNFRLFGFIEGFSMETFYPRCYFSSLPERQYEKKDRALRTY